MLRRLAVFRKDRRGALAPIAALTAVALVIAAGASVDIGRAARDRALLQDIADSAALAGASQADPTSAVNSATAYVNAALAAMSDKPTVTPTYQAASQSTYDTPPATGAPFTVKLAATMATSLTAMVMKSLPINVSATAVTAVGQKVTFTLSNYHSDAADHNVIYGYGYDPTAYSATKGNLYTYVPTLDPNNVMLDNHQSYSSTYTKTFYIGVNQVPAFALSNTTGTSQNCYGGANGTNRIYYSHRLDSAGSYHDFPTENINWCGFSKVTANSDGTQTIDDYQQVIPLSDYSNECYSCLVSTTTTTTWSPCTPSSSNNGYGNGGYYGNGNHNNNGNHRGQCRDDNGDWVTPTSTTTTSTSGPANQWNTPFVGDGKHGYVYLIGASRNPLLVSTPSMSCATAGGVTYRWDDNGGGSDSGITSPSVSGDDDDHNDMVFTVTCTTAVKPGNPRLSG